MQNIQLSDGNFTIVDDEDYIILKNYKWSNNGVGYVQGWIDGKYWLIHRFIMKAIKGQEIDHINRDKLDNRKENLRFCTRRENCLNSDRCENAGKAKITYKNTQRGTKKWCVYRYDHCKFKFICYSYTKEEALEIANKYNLDMGICF